MNQRNSKFEFLALLTFLGSAFLLLSNGFVSRINAAENRVDVYQQIEPLGKVIDIVLQEYVREAEMDKVVEGALMGILQSLDRHSSFITREELQAMREDTRGEFEGIGVSIRPGEDGSIVVVTPIPGSPAAEAGLLPYDIIVQIDDISTRGMTPADAADKIRGPKGTSVKLTVIRPDKDPEKDGEIKEFFVNRDTVPLESVKESGLIGGKIGYARVSDFKENTARDLRVAMEKLISEGMQAFILDLRWNPGGLLTSSKEVSQLFLPKNSLVTYTKGREKEGKPNREDMQLYTEARPVVPPDLPVIVLVNENTASSSEIVTGALQFHERALILGEKTFGKGSVQTIIPLDNPPMTALRLTTALYYTPADVTIDHQGILPDLEVAMDFEQERALGQQMYESYEKDPSNKHMQNHGTITGASTAEELVEDVQLQRAVEVLQEEPVWERLLAKYHRDVHETQVAFTEETPEKALEEQHQEQMEQGLEPVQEDVVPEEAAPADGDATKTPETEAPAGVE